MSRAFFWFYFEFWIVQPNNLVTIGAIGTTVVPEYRTAARWFPCFSARSKKDFIMNDEYVLVRDKNGRHYEKFVSWNNPAQIANATKEAHLGTLSGHIPEADAVYASRTYGYPTRLLIKLTKKK